MKVATAIIKFEDGDKFFEQLKQQCIDEILEALCGNVQENEGLIKSISIEFNQDNVRKKAKEHIKVERVTK